MLRRIFFVCFILGILSWPVDAARETIFGLEKVVITGVFDPNARTERMLLVSGSLKLVGMGRGGNTWQTVTYIPQRTAVPRSDHGIFQRIGNILVFYSHITFTTFTGEIQPDGERLVVDRFGNGKRQRETWYLVRGGQNL
ncbi:MAG: hypothetical protein QGG64_17025 [Candidatus Latescibacteria bacterium]|nr:hypothetical protein [Candidatus Latescibacterota bacterium]